VSEIALVFVSLVVYSSECQGVVVFDALREGFEGVADVVRRQRAGEGFSVEANQEKHSCSFGDDGVVDFRLELWPLFDKALHAGNCSGRRYER